MYINGEPAQALLDCARAKGVTAPPRPSALAKPCSAGSSPRALGTTKHSTSSRPRMKGAHPLWCAGQAQEIMDDVFELKPLFCNSCGLPQPTRVIKGVVGQTPSVLLGELGWRAGRCASCEDGIALHDRVLLTCCRHCWVAPPQLAMPLPPCGESRCAVAPGSPHTCSAPPPGRRGGR